MKRRARTLAMIGVLFGATAVVASVVSAGDTAWIAEGSIAGGVVDSELAESQDDNDCEDYINIPSGAGPGWARVGGAVDPHAPIVEVSGQLLDPQAYVSFPSDDDQSLPQRVKTNAFVTHTDNSLNHFGRDINAFITLDPEDRFRLAHGNFVEGDANEHGHMEIEWERGGVPMFAFPAIGDRMTVWGPHIFDCGHGDTWVEVGPDDDDTYRTEIHPPHGWVLYRHTADADGVPQDGKQNQSPWQWYESTDGQGAGNTLPNSGLLFSTVQTTVADAYFTSYGGNAIESLNGCDDFDDPALTCFDYDERPELSGNEDIDSWEWHSPILDSDYTFVVPAPPKPAGAYPDVTLEWDFEDRCNGVPADPTIPSKHVHPEAVDDEVEGREPFTIYASDRPIGAPGSCNPTPTGAIPLVVEEDPEGDAPWNDTGQAAIRATVRARTGADGIDGNGDDPTYPSNDYISFAYRLKVGWDHAPPEEERPRRYRVDFDTLRVYDDGEPCIDPGDSDGEWIISLRANDQYVHPVEGTVEDDNDGDDLTEPLWEDEAIDDDQCGLDDATFKSYELGADGAGVLSMFVTALAGEPIEIWERAYDKDDESEDDLSPTIRQFLTPPAPGGSQQYVVGNGDIDVEMSHTIALSITDVTPPVPANGPLTFGAPSYGPNDDTQQRIRVSGETPVTVDAPSGVSAIQYRLWAEGATPPAWSYDFDGSDGFQIDVPDTGSCVCIVEWATIQGSGGDSTVSARTRQTIEVDNVAPTLVVPDDFSVYANQAAGATVEYVTSATDDFPGPISIVCSPGSGSVFPNGSNAPLTTTVTCTAADTVENATSASFDVTVISPVEYVNDYVLLGLEWLDTERGTVVTDGNVGVYDASAGMPNEPGLELRIGLDGALPTDDLVAGHTIALGRRVVAGDVFFADALFAEPTATYSPVGPCDPNAPASLEPCAYVPLWGSLPTLLPAAPGAGTAKYSGKTIQLVPGSYGIVELSPNSIATLAPGDYSFASLELKPGATLRFSGPTTLRVAGRMILQRATVEPTGTATASDLVVHVAGTDVSATKSAVDITSPSTVALNVYAPNGTVSIGNNSELTGAVIGRRVDVGANVTVTIDSAFLLP